MKGHYLRKCGWSYDRIGMAAALAGLTSWLLNSPAGFLIDQTRRRRVLLAGASLLVGFCFALLPLACEHQVWVFVLLGLAGVGKTFFGPLTNALTLGMTGHVALNRSLGVKEGWNHAGNIAAALTAMLLVSRFPVTSVFVAVAFVSVLAAASAFLIRAEELGHERIGPSSLALSSAEKKPVRFAEVIRDRRVAILLASATLFHLANAPVMPLVSQKITHVGGQYPTVRVDPSIQIPLRSIRAGSGLAGATSRRMARAPTDPLRSVA